MTDISDIAGESVAAKSEAVNECDGASDVKTDAPAKRKKSAAKILKEYYARRAIMYKEMYEHGSTSR